MCEISNSESQRFKSCYFSDKPPSDIMLVMVQCNYNCMPVQSNLLRTNKGTDHLRNRSAPFCLITLFSICAIL